MADRIRVGRLSVRDRPLALARLRRDPRLHLLLIDQVERLGRRGGGRMRAEVLGAWRGEHLEGVAARRPLLLLESGLRGPVLDRLLDELVRGGAILVRADARTAERVRHRLRSHRRRSVLDRREVALVVEPARLRPRAPAPGVRLRAAEERDLPALVFAAREGLREEGRPDPFPGDPSGFVAWVRSRLPGARVAEIEGEVVFVAYADLRRTEGWLVQGVYTWPEHRRRGLAAAGVSALCAEAFAAGAEHVQLSVVEGNRPALALYRQLGFQRFGELCTLVFV